MMNDKEVVVYTLPWRLLEPDITAFNEETHNL